MITSIHNVNGKCYDRFSWNWHSVWLSDNGC